MSHKVITRFAPSPTGYLHVGSLRTALYSYLWAKKNKGKFFLRIEDTDQERTVEGAEKNLKEILILMGLPYDNTDTMRQSDRLDVYLKKANELVQIDKAYHCFCSQDRLKELRESQVKKNIPSHYDGKCRSLSPELVKAALDKKEKFVVRLKMPQRGSCIFVDLVRGKTEFAYETQDDAIVLKSDGFPTYHLSHVVDDYEMKITHVIRGEEWLPSMPKHLFLWEAFGWDKPEFAHLPLLLNSDRTKLSKRQGDVAVEDFLQNGYLKEAILNFILLLGWNPGTEQEVFSLQEMIKAFDLKKVNKAGAIFNRDKLDWLNGWYIRNTKLDEFLELVWPKLVEAGLVSDKTDKDFVRKVVALEQDRIKTLSELPPLLDFYFQEISYDANLILWKKQNATQAKQNLEDLLSTLDGLADTDYTLPKLETAIKKLIEEKDVKVGEMLWPMRVALSGKKASPSPFELAEVFGKQESHKRIQEAVRKLATLS